jgi:signal transduction histidine kinase
MASLSVVRQQIGRFSRIAPLARRAADRAVGDMAPYRATRLIDRWNALSLATQFLLAGGLFSLSAMIVVGISVTSQIEAAVTRNSASATALYVDSVIAPLLPDMRRSEVLEESVAHALDETLGQGALGKRLQSFKLWRRDGTILYSTNKQLVGKRFPPSDDLRAAFAGDMVAEFDKLEGLDSQAERDSGLHLLEIYNPVLQPWSGEVVAVLEFYEIATDFETNLRQALVRTWLDVAAVTAVFFLGLSAIVFRGSRTIRSQSLSLKQRIAELSDLLAQNRMLRLRVQRASQRATALNERYLRRIGADLHDGPAQLVALAALGIDSPVLADPATPAAARARELRAVKANLDDAMREIRNVSKGLVLPHVENAELTEILELAVRAHEERTGVKVMLSMTGGHTTLSPSAKICIFRFIQEALNNGFRHAGGAGQSVAKHFDGERVCIEVSDTGPGFDANIVNPERLGLVGLRERVESLGGQFAITSSKNGTMVKMVLNTVEMGQA